MSGHGNQAVTRIVADHAVEGGHVPVEEDVGEVAGDWAAVSAEKDVVWAIVGDLEAIGERARRSDERGRCSQAEIGTKRPSITGFVAAIVLTR